MARRQGGKPSKHSAGLAPFISICRLCIPRIPSRSTPRKCSVSAPQLPKTRLPFALVFWEWQELFVYLACNNRGRWRDQNAEKEIEANSYGKNSFWWCEPPPTALWKLFVTGATRPSFKALIALAYDFANTLLCLHSIGICHGDLRSHNIVFHLNVNKVD
jgi:hypothetical protein